MPTQDGITLPDEYGKKIMHMSLPISRETVLMGSDSGGEWAPETIIGNNITLSINAESKEKADHYFNSLAEGGKVTMALESTFWGDYFGMCTDKFNINWMVSFNENPQK